jgi:hypothetical protein
MFALADSYGNPITAKYALDRMRWEPVVEVTQIKGDGETHPLLSPDDTFADFEPWDKGNLLATALKEEWMLKHEYARSALKLGLEVEAETGVNPYKFGMIGSSDAHTGMATAREDNYWGKLSIYEPSPERWEHAVFTEGEEGKVYTLQGYEMGAAGYAAVWATENTRAALFEAMQRKEVYATTGSRITVRFFGGWDFRESDVSRPDFVNIGYHKGVPMGGDLPRAPKGGSPVFMVSALKDPNGANLDRIQIIKGWFGSDGVAHETIFDVAASDRRRIAQGRVIKPVSNTVKVEKATYKNTFGDVELSAVWRDPDFRPGQRAFYYARVIEIPKPRWTAYDAKFFGLTMPPEVPMTVQDRAYTSPIWYTPSAQ